MADPTWDPAEGPFDTQPVYGAPDHPFGHAGRWAQAEDGKWYAFYSNLGPGEEYHYQHPNDPHWWAYTPDADPTNLRDGDVWACRHGHFQGSLGGGGLANCGTAHPHHPNLAPPEPPVTDEEVEEAGRALAKLLASMESK